MYAEQVKDAGGWSYKAEGSVNFFGESLVRVDGAGGPIESVRAYAFTLPVAALKKWPKRRLMTRHRLRSL